MELGKSVGGHVTIHTEEGAISGILTFVSKGTGPQYVTIKVTNLEGEPRLEHITWHQIRKIVPYTQMDEKILKELEGMNV